MGIRKLMSIEYLIIIRLIKRRKPKWHFKYHQVLVQEKDLQELYLLSTSIGAVAIQATQKTF